MPDTEFNILGFIKALRSQCHTPTRSQCHTRRGLIPDSKYIKKALKKLCPVLLYPLLLCGVPTGACLYTVEGLWEFIVSASRGTLQRGPASDTSAVSDIC